MSTSLKRGAAEVGKGGGFCHTVKIQKDALALQEDFCWSNKYHRCRSVKVSSGSQVPGPKEGPRTRMLGPMSHLVYFG